MVVALFTVACWLQVESVPRGIKLLPLGLYTWGLLLLVGSRWNMFHVELDCFVPQNNLSPTRPNSAMVLMPIRPNPTTVSVPLIQTPAVITTSIDYNTNILETLSESGKTIPLIFSPSSLDRLSSNSGKRLVPYDTIHLSHNFYFLKIKIKSNIYRAPCSLVYPSHVLFFTQILVFL